MVCPGCGELLDLSDSAIPSTMVMSLRCEKCGALFAGVAPEPPHVPRSLVRPYPPPTPPRPTRSESHTSPLAREALGVGLIAVGIAMMALHRSEELPDLVAWIGATIFTIGIALGM